MQLNTQEKEEKLNELWFNRNQLNEKQWAELYELIWDILRFYKPSALKDLSSGHEDYIQQFFLKKVFRKTSSENSGEIHSGFITFCYKRFLDSQFKSATEKRTRQTDSLDHDDFVEKQENNLTKQDIYEQQLDEIELLNEYGVQMDTLSQSAKSFYNNLETWAQQYLSLHFCPDAQESLPLNALAKRYQISSYHYKAGLLGITRKKSDSYKDYHQTLLGDWIINTLKINLGKEHGKIMLLILKILCLTALSSKNV